MNALSEVLVAAALAAAASGASAASMPSGPATTDVYRCTTADGGVVYLDQPCRGGVKLDIAPGVADPAAIEKLRRDQEADARRQAARDAQAREVELQREIARTATPYVVPVPAWAPYDDSLVNSPWFWGGWFGYSPWWGPAPAKPRPPPRPPRATTGSVPAHPANPVRLPR